MDRGGRGIGGIETITFEQLGEPGFVEIADRAVAIWLDPFWMLQPKIVVNLKLKRRERIVRLSRKRFRRSEHHHFDNY